MTVQLEQTHVGPWPAIALSNDAVRVVVLPEVGGKIVSLEHVPSGREWLWKNPQLPIRRPPPHVTDYSQFDSGGWDEVIPTITPCLVPNSAWRDRPIVDHGELWHRPWQIAAAKCVANHHAELALAVDEQDSPFRFARTLVLSDGFTPLEIEYELTNRSELPMPYIWAAHPLLAIEPGDMIRLPHGTWMRPSTCVGLAIVDAPFRWPFAPVHAGKAIDLSSVPDRDADVAIKLFAENITPGEIEIFAGRTRAFLRFTFHPVEVPHIGLWLNYGGWSGISGPAYYNIGVEPSTTPCDDLQTAVSQDAAFVLQSGEARRWRVAVALGIERGGDWAAEQPPDAPALKST
jgi:hypothetical protein